MPKWKTKRRIMHSFKMGEISGVDVPAQEGAKIVLAKRAGGDDDIIDMAKGAFNSILAERKVEEEAQRAFWEAFEDQWMANDAFKTALCDAYSNSEEVLREYIEKLTEMAQDAAFRIQNIRKGDKLGKSLYFGAVAEAANQLISDQEDNPMFKTLAELKAAIAKFEKDGGDADLIKNIRKSAVDLDQPELLTGDLAFAAPVTPEESEDVATLKRQVAVLSLDADMRKHFDGLGEDAQTAFLAKSADEQKAEVAAANADDPVLFKSKDGTEYRKSDGPLLAKLARENEELRGDLEKSQSENADAAFEKQAASEFQYLPREGTVAMLKAADKMSDDEKKKMLEAMRANNAQAKKSHKAIGSSAGASGEEGEEGTPSDQLDKMAADYAKANDVPMHKAYDKVLETDEGAALYAKMVGQEPVVEDAD